MIDYGELVREDVGSGLAMLWVAVAANPLVVFLLGAIVVGALWLQATPARRRLRR